MHLSKYLNYWVAWNYIWCNFSQNKQIKGNILKMTRLPCQCERKKIFTQMPDYILAVGMRVSPGGNSPGHCPSCCGDNWTPLGK